MKNLLLTLMLAVLTTFTYAQLGCSPDPQFIAPGIYPDTATGLSDAFVGQAYSENITIIVPVDTVVTVAGFGSITADFLSIELTNVTGLPPNFTYTCDPSNCSFPGGTTKCAEVYSTTNPTIPDIGFYPITFECIAHLSALMGQITADCTYVESGYSIEIFDNTTAVIHQFNNQTFELRNPSPNPVLKQAEIQFISGKSDDIVFAIYNLLGKQVYLRRIKATSGLNIIDINTSSFSEGIYLYSINNGNKVLTNRMIVSDR